MRILFVHNEYGITTGEEHSIEAISNLLTQHGHQVSWFKRSSAEISSSIAGKFKAFFTGIHNPFAAKGLAQMLDEIKPDIVMVQNLYPLLSTAIFKPIKKRNIPVVMRCPNYRLFCPNGLHLSKGKICENCLGFGKELWCIMKNCEKNIFKSIGYALRNAAARTTGQIIKNVDMFIVQTRFQKQKFSQRGIPVENISILPGIIPSTAFKKNSNTGNVVTFIGRLSKEKGIEDFVEAARLLPNIPFVVAGKYNSQFNLMNFSPPNIKWLGFVEGEQLQDLYRQSRCIVIPSCWYEGFPNVAAQAMAHSKPVIASRIGALTSIIDDHKTGLLFEAGNFLDLSQKIRTLWNQPELSIEMGKAAREKAIEEYSQEKCYGTLMGIFQKTKSTKPEITV